MTRARSDYVDHETSTEQPAPQTHARVSQADGNQGRAARVEAPTGQGKKTAHGVGRGGVARLARAAEIRRVFEAGRRVSRGPLTVIGLAAEGRAGARIGIIVGRKFGGAVQRNRIKRRLRVIIARLDAVPDGRDLLILPRSSVQQWSFQALTDAVAALLATWERAVP
jgi:ribonuclease P protein component